MRSALNSTPPRLKDWAQSTVPPAATNQHAEASRTAVNFRRNMLWSLANLYDTIDRLPRIH